MLSISSNSAAASLLVFRDTGSHGADAVVLEFPKKAAGGSLEAGRSSKRVPMYQMSSVYQAAKQESQLSIPRGLGILIG